MNRDRDSERSRSSCPRPQRKWSGQGLNPSQKSFSLLWAPLSNAVPSGTSLIGCGWVSGSEEPRILLRVPVGGRQFSGKSEAKCEVQVGIHGIFGGLTDSHALVLPLTARASEAPKRTTDLQSWETMTFCRVSRTVYGTLSWQPKKSRTVFITLYCL